MADYSTKGPAAPDDHTGGLAAMLAGTMKKAPVPNADGGSDDADGAPDEGEQAAADDMMSAMKSGDSTSFASGLKAFVQICLAKY